MSEANATRVKLISSITAPLGFFVLALLIVEVFLGAVLVGSNIAPETKAAGLWVGLLAFLLVILLVFLLVWFKPENLVYDKDVLSERMRHRDYLAHAKSQSAK